MPNLEMSDHLVLCNWSPRALDWIREVHSGIVTDKRPVVIVHDTPDEVVLPDKQDEAAFNDVYIVKGDPANEVILRRAKVAQAHSVVILSDDRQDQHADGKTIVCCIAVKNVCVQERQPNIVAECQDPKYRPHMRKAGADEVISAADFGLRLMARASLFHGMTRVYQELLSVRRDANEMYLVPVPAQLVGMDFVAAANVFLPDRTNMKACLLIGLYRGETMMLNPVGGEAGPLREGDELILLSQTLPDLSRPTAAACAETGATLAAHTTSNAIASNVAPAVPRSCRGRLEDSSLDRIAPSILPPVLAAIGPGGIDDLVPVVDRILSLVLRLFLLLLRFPSLLPSSLRAPYRPSSFVLREGDERDAQHPQPCQKCSSTEGALHNLSPFGAP